MDSINWKIYFILISLCIITSPASAVAVDYPDKRPSIEAGKKYIFRIVQDAMVKKGMDQLFPALSISRIAKR